MTAIYCFSQNKNGYVLICLVWALIRGRGPYANKGGNWIDISSAFDAEKHAQVRLSKTTKIFKKYFVITPDLLMFLKSYKIMITNPIRRKCMVVWMRQ